MSRVDASFVSAIASAMDHQDRQQEQETAAAFEALKVLKYTGPVMFHFQHGTAKTMQLMNPTTWKLT